MSTAFNLADELDELRYDFRTEHNKRAPHGVIPEPSTEQLDKFTNTIRLLNLAAAIEGDELKGLSNSDLMARLTAAEDNKDSMEPLIVAVSEVCSGHPSVEDIKSLPFRAQRAFFGWITGVLLDPKS